MNINTATFVTSCVTLGETRRQTLPAIAFVGRSNVGKSSLLNMLVGQKDLAKTSSKPGKTQTINYFLINNERHLADVPGYGYAKKSIEERIEWMDILQKFMTKNNNLRMTFVLIDATIPLTKNDAMFLEILINEGVRISVIMTKTDKAKQSAIQKNKAEILNFCQEIGLRGLNIFEVSAKKHQGKNEILTHIESYIAENEFPPEQGEMDENNDENNDENIDENTVKYETKNEKQNDIMDSITAKLKKK